MPPTRFERVASGLGILRSIHLSYGGAKNSQSISDSYIFFPASQSFRLCLLTATRTSAPSNSCFPARFWASREDLILRIRWASHTKALHLLALKLFPLWDRAIAEAYDAALGTAGSNGDHYWRFRLISQRQSADLKRADPACHNPLESIDEYNYCKHTKKWL